MSLRFTHFCGCFLRWCLGMVRCLLCKGSSHVRWRGSNPLLGCVRPRLTNSSSPLRSRRPRRRRTRTPSKLRVQGSSSDHPCAGWAAWPSFVTPRLGAAGDQPYRAGRSPAERQGLEPRRRFRPPYALSGGAPRPAGLSPCLKNLPLPRLAQGSEGFRPRAKPD